MLGLLSLTFNRQMLSSMAQRGQRDLQVVAAAEVGHLERDHEAVHRIFQAHLLRYPQVYLQVLGEGGQRCD